MEQVALMEKIARVAFAMHAQALPPFATRNVESTFGEAQLILRALQLVGAMRALVNN
jgi:hypothetical protein